MRLAGRVVLVTGGGKGIGAAYSKGLAAEGARVGVADIDLAAAEETAAAIEAAGGEALAIHLDVTRPESARAMAEAVFQRWGRIDVLVNNAALYAVLPQRDFWEIPLDEWDRVMAVNLKGLFLCSRAVHPYMKAQGHGKIINISSGTAFKGSPRLLHYVTSKAGVIGFTRALAREVGRDGIAVNAIAPGLTESGTNKETTPEEHFEQNLRTRAIQRRQQPSDLVGACLYLASSDSDFVTGQTIVVDGGAAMH